MNLTPDQNAKLKRLAQEIVDTIGLKQGHVECHVSGGKVKALPVMDKGIKFDE